MNVSLISNVHLDEVIIILMIGGLQKSNTTTKLNTNNTESSINLFKAITKPKDIEIIIKDIASDPTKLQDCNDSARAIIRKRKRINLKAIKRLELKDYEKKSNQINYITTEKFRYKEILKLRDKIELNSITRKFVIAHKPQVSTIYVYFLYI